MKNGEVIGDGTKEEIIKLVEKDKLSKNENIKLDENEDMKMTLEDVYMYFYDEKSEE